MTNLLIAHNRYTIDATLAASSTNSSYDANDIISGGRGDRWLANTAESPHTLKYTLATARGANFYIIGRADLSVRDDTVSFVVDYSDDDAAWTEFHDSTNLAVSDLVGPNSEDYLYYTTTAEAAHQYWRLSINNGGSALSEISKFYIGTAFDIGRDPASFESRRVRGGHVRRKPRYEFSVQWIDISYTKTVELLDTVGEIADYHPVFLFTDTYDAILMGDKCVHCQVMSLDTPQVITNRNNISMVFRELI